MTRYPLNQGQIFWRETTCFFLGHTWRLATRRRTQYYGVSAKEVPYAVRKTTGNYMYECIPWWEAKCTRCRYKVRPDDTDVVWNPWYRVLGEALTSAWVWGVKYHFNQVLNAENSRRRQQAHALLIPIAAYKDFFLCFHSAPWSWWTWSADLEYKIYQWADSDEDGKD